MIDYSLILKYNFADDTWALNGDDYDGLDWLSHNPKPTKADLDALWESTLKAKQDAETADKTRKAALLQKLGITSEEVSLLLKL